MNSQNNFPIYRKYKGINVWFKIIDDRNFIELKQIGDKFIIHHIEAKQYPEICLIQDLINCAEGRWVETNGDFFEQHVF